MAQKYRPEVLQLPYESIGLSDVDHYKVAKQ